jgi:hypothetical protein
VFLFTVALDNLISDDDFDDPNEEGQGQDDSDAAVLTVNDTNINASAALASGDNDGGFEEWANDPGRGERINRRQQALRQTPPSAASPSATYTPRRGNTQAHTTDDGESKSCN